MSLSRQTAPLRRANRSARAHILFSTSAVGLALALSASPHLALAANECGVAAPAGTVTCAPGTYTGISYPVNGGVTVNLPAGVTVTTNGVFVQTGSGNVTITADSSDTLTNTVGERPLGRAYHLGTSL